MGETRNAPARLRPDRRRFLRYGVPAVCFTALGHPLLGAYGEAAGRRPAADGCIIVLLTGGPSHLDTFDPKPGAPAEVRGPFGTIQTAVSGVRLTEHLPKLAKQLHRCALVRSVHHKVRVDHAAAAYVALTGVGREDASRPASRGDHPSFGSVIAMKRGRASSPLPYVWLPFRTSEVGLGGEPIPGMLAGFLGARFDPFFVLDDPSEPDFSVPALEPQPGLDAGRMRGRARLLDGLGRRGPAGPGSQWRALQEHARDVLTSPKLQGVFSMKGEPESLKEAYGKDQFGGSLLLARRLIEAGSRVVCVSMGSNLNNTWDTHFDNFNKLKSELLPRFDAAFSTLVADLAERGLLGRTLVLAFGEFGRTPKVEKGGGQGPGRDHWPYCYAALLAGGGVRGGSVLGSSDRIGAYPSSDPVAPADILATAYHCLGVPPGPASDLTDPEGKPVSVAPGGEPIGRLVH